MFILPKAIYTFNAILIKIPAFLTILKLYGTTKDPKKQSNLEKAKQSWRHHKARLQVILQSCSGTKIDS